MILYSVGVTLTDTLDDLIMQGRIDPQLAMKVLTNFDRSITEILSDKVKANLSFKVVTWSSLVAFVCMREISG